MKREELTDSNLRRLFGNISTRFVFLCFFFSVLCFSFAGAGSYLNKIVVEANGHMPLIWEVPDMPGPSIVEQEQGVRYPFLADRFCTYFSTFENAPEWLLNVLARFDIKPTGDHCIPASIGDILSWTALPLWVLASLSWILALCFAIHHQLHTTLSRPILAISTFVSLAYFFLGIALMFFPYFAIHSHSAAIIVPQ